MNVWRTLAGLLAAGIAGHAAAATLRISPVGFELPAGQRAASLSVRDDGDAAMTVQVRVFRWSQRGGIDVLEPTDALLASPPFASLDPGAEQTVRLIRADANPGADAEPEGGEQCFRLLIDELPPATGDAGRQVKLLMRHSVPVFVEPARAVRPQVAWRSSAGAGSVRLDAVNAGARRLRIADVRIEDAQGRPVAEQLGLVGYVLAHSQISFALARTAAAGGGAIPARMQAQTDLGSIDVALSGAP